jgi:hypothetical protein
MIKKGAALPLLSDDLLDLGDEVRWCDQFSEGDLRMRNFDEFCQVTARRSQPGDVAPRYRLARSVNSLLDVVSKPVVSDPRLSGGDLERNRVEGGVVTCGVTPHHCGDVLALPSHELPL